MKPRSGRFESQDKIRNCLVIETTRFSSETKITGAVRTEGLKKCLDGWRSQRFLRAYPGVPKKPLGELLRLE